MNKISQFGSSSSLSKSTVSSQTPRNNKSKDVNFLAQKFWQKIKSKAQTASKPSFITVSDER